ncbi:MAG: hypothetical protein F4X15_09940 [Gemmatimonadetes bacterium]|nr:hypothetical protein [Gemmatimonadota bacterium]
MSRANAPTVMGGWAAGRLGGWAAGRLGGSLPRAYGTRRPDARARSRSFSFRAAALCHFTNAPPSQNCAHDTCPSSKAQTKPPNDRAFLDLRAKTPIRAWSAIRL